MCSEHLPTLVRLQGTSDLNRLDPQEVMVLVGAVGQNTLELLPVLEVQIRRAQWYKLGEPTRIRC